MNDPNFAKNLAEQPSPAVAAEPPTKKLELVFDRARVTHVRSFECPPGATGDQIAGSLMAQVGAEVGGLDAARLYYLTDDNGHPVEADGPLWDKIPGEKGRFRVRRRDVAGAAA